jgi:hypothetical protein
VSALVVKNLQRLRKVEVEGRLLIYNQSLYSELYGTGNDKGERYWNLPDASHIVVSFSFVTGRRRRGDNECERGRKEEVEVEIKCVALRVYPSISRDGRDYQHE